MKAVCHNCGSTGWTQSPHVYDCSQCDMAETRAALEAALRADEAKNGLMDWEDQLLFAYNFKMEKTMSDENTKPSVDRNAVLEEAARVCEIDHPHTFARNVGKYIRALKSAAPAKPEPAVPSGWIYGDSFYEVGNPCLNDHIRTHGRPMFAAAPVAQPLAPSGAVPDCRAQLAKAIVDIEMESISNEGRATSEEEFGYFHDGYCAGFFAARRAAYLLVKSDAAAQPFAGQDGRAVTEWQPIETAPEVKGDCFFCQLAWGPEGDQSTGDGLRWQGRWFASAVFYALGKPRKYEFRELEVFPTHWRPSQAVPSTINPKQDSQDQ